MLGIPIHAGDAQRAAAAPSVGVGLCCARRVASRWRMQAWVLVVCKVGAAHSLAALTSYLVAFAAAAVWLLPLLLLLLLCHCCWIGCVFLKELTRPDQTPFIKN